MNSRSSLLCLLAVVVITIGVRGAAVLASADAFRSDPDAYFAIATTVQQSGVFGLTSPAGEPRPIAFRPPLYPWLLSFFVGGEYSHFAIAILHVVLATATSCLTFALTRRLVRELAGPSSTARENLLGVAAASLTVIDPILLRQSTMVMTETLATTLTMVALMLWYALGSLRRPRNESPAAAWNLILPVAFGASLGMAYLCRPTFLVWAAMLTIAIAAEFRNRRGLLFASITAAVVFLAVAGWTFRNQRVMGAPIWATTHGGYTLLLANNESFYQYLSDGDFGVPWDAEPFLNAYRYRFEGDPREASFWQKEWTGAPSVDPTITESEDDRLCYESAVATIKRHPKVFVWSAVVRAGRLWSPIPHNTARRSRFGVLAVGCFYVMIFAAVFVSILRHRTRMFRSEWWAAWLLVITLTGVHAVYWSNMRMRAPAMPAIAMLAVVSMVRRNGEHD